MGFHGVGGHVHGVVHDLQEEFAAAEAIHVQDIDGFFTGLTSSGATLTVALYVYAKEQGEFEVAFAIAAILMILTLIINLAANFVGKKLKQRQG